ncbi:MAG: ABC transporter ATP-binding protein [Lachnospirales bacterium]
MNFNDIEVYKDFTLEIGLNEITCIIGPSGCGKTSILNVVSGLNKNYKGEVNINSMDVGYIFQEDRLLPWETVYNNVSIVKSNNKKKIMEILKDLELYEFKDKYPHELSGGLRQRCSLARGFYFNPKVLLMDEPYKSLDYDLKISLINYLTNLWKKNKNTIIFVTHDIDEALLLGNKIVVLSKRPTRILKEFFVNTSIEIRNINTAEHNEIRKEIINLLTKKGF